MVTKKGGKQRLIIDARRTNKLFRKPPTTILGSVDALSRLEIEGEDTHVFMAQEDVKDYFYRLSIDRGLGEYFCLPMVDGLLLKEYLGFLPDEFTKLSDQFCSPIYPHLSVLPMGFAWAFHLAHEAHCHLARLCLPHVPQLRDRRSAPKLGRGEGSSVSAVMIYADNANHFGIDRGRVSKEQAELMKVLHTNNLDTHDIVDSCNLAESLGVRIDGIGGKVQPTPHRDWRLHRALQYLSARPVLTGEQLQVVVGHITVRSLLNRGLMGVLRRAYVFIEQSYHTRQRLWRSVAKEMDIFRGLMVLGCSDLRAAWDCQPLCTDACLSGYAVMESSLGQEVAAMHGRHDERWRFKRQAGLGLGPRARALNSAVQNGPPKFTNEGDHKGVWGTQARNRPDGGFLDSADVFDDPLTVKPDINEPLEQVFVEDADFPEVISEHLGGSDWHLLWNTKIHHKELVHLIEARSVLAAVKHRARDSTRHGKRILIFNDNMGVVLSVQKGRSCSYGLLRLIRRIAAHCLASGIRLCVRWVPSEYNVADAPSRQWEQQKPKASGKAGGAGFQSKCSGSFKQTNEEPRQRDDGIQKEEREVAFEDGRRGRPSNYEPCVEEALGASEKEEREGKKSAKEVCSEIEGEHWTNGDPGAGERERAPAQGLCQEASRVLRVRGFASPSNFQRGRVGRGFVRLRRSHVLEWRRERCRPETQSSFGVCSSGSHQKIGDTSSQVQEEPQGLEKVGPYPDKASYDRICEELHKCYHAIYPPTYDGFAQRADILNLCQTGGTNPSYGCGCGEEERPVLTRCHSALPFRENGGLESWDLRRSVDPGRYQNEMPWRHSSSRGFSKNAEEWRRRKAVGFHPGPVSQDLAGLRGSARSGGCSSEPLSKQTWRSITGSSSSSQIGGFDPAKGKVGCGLKRSHLRQARSTSADNQPVQSKATAPGRANTHSLPGLFLWEASPTSSTAEAKGEAPLQEVTFLSLFGGVGNPAIAVANGGGRGFVIDLCHSSKNDLGLHSKWNPVLKHVDDFDIFGIDLPCNTWSRARRAPPWSRLPKPLRKPGCFIFGMPNLSAQDFEKVRKANTMLKRSVQLIRKCLRLGKTGYLENPRSSMLWKTPDIQRLLCDSRVQLIHFDMCQYGTQWKKPTTLLVWGCRPFSLLKCQHTGVCVRTKKPHLQLTGIGGKKFLTSQAQVYTAEFSNHLMLSIAKFSLPKTSPTLEPF